MGQVASGLFTFINAYLSAILPAFIGNRDRRNGEDQAANSGVGDENAVSSDESSAGGRRCTSLGCGGTTFFGSHFLMGGELYDTPKQEVFLFGAQHDLEFLEGRPVKFPHCSKGVTDSVGVLNALVNVRRDSVKFIKIGRSGSGYSSGFYRLEFVFDCDVPCFVQIHCCAREFFDDFQQIQFISRPSHQIDSSERYHFPVGANQQFNHFVFKPHRFDLKLMHWDGSSAYFPVLIVIRSVSEKFPEQTQSTICSIERSTDQSAALILKPLKQKLFANGVVYLLQEIYGIENKENAENFSLAEENGAECIICMANPRDTMILPCRHLCICNGCAETLRYKLNNCPICRSPFKALLKIRAVRSSLIGLGSSDGMASTLRIRREPITLFEAVNGPLQSPNAADLKFVVSPQQQMGTKASLVGSKGDVIVTTTSKTASSADPIVVDHHTTLNAAKSLRLGCSSRSKFDERFPFQRSVSRMAPKRSIGAGGRSLGQSELNVENIELEEFERARKKNSHGGSSFIQYSPGSGAVTRRTSHSPTTSRRAILQRPSPLSSAPGSSNRSTRSIEQMVVSSEEPSSQFALKEKEQKMGDKNAS